MKTCVFKNIMQKKTLKFSVKFIDSDQISGVDIQFGVIVDMKVAENESTELRYLKDCT